MNGTANLRVVVFQEDDRWVAQCVEYDIGAQGKTFDEMAVHFALTMRADIQESVERHGQAFAGIDRAPAYFQRKWEERSGDVTPVHVSVDVPSYDMALVA